MSGLLNRVAIIIYPKQPFVDWANSLNPGDEPMTLEFVQETPAVFLIGDNTEPEAGPDLMKICMNGIMVGWLGSFTDDEASWPKKRDWEFFNAWFDWVITPEVSDLEDDPIEVYPPEDKDDEEFERALREKPPEESSAS